MEGYICGPGPSNDAGGPCPRMAPGPCFRSGPDPCLANVLHRCNVGTAGRG